MISRFSLDETFDIGEDTGTPVVLDYEAKMPFAFTGTLKKLTVLLQPENLTEAQKEQLLKDEASGMALLLLVVSLALFILFRHIARRGADFASVGR